MSDESHTLQTFVNPLLFFSLDPLFTGRGLKKKRFSSASFLRDLVGKPTLDARKEIEARHESVAPLENDLYCVPDDPRLLARIVWPLRLAKATYLLGGYLACIALAGTVGETVAVFVFNLARLTLRGKSVDRGIQRGLFGGSFEELSQYRRTRVLAVLGLWDDQHTQKADELRTIRNKYLHRLSVDLTEIQQDALQAYALAVQLAAAAINLPIGAEGTVKITPQLRRYLKQAKAQDG